MVPYFWAMSRNPRHDAAGPSQRQLRVAELIRRTLSQILARGEVHDEVLGRTSVTVSEVRCTADLKQATAFVMPLGGDGAEEVLRALREQKGELRHLLAKGMVLKHVPELRFQIDDTFDKMDETRRMFSDEKVRRDIEQ